MKVDAGQLATFATVIDEGSFEAAATRMHVTPSAVSQRVKALEAALGQVLVRRSRPVLPTEAGQILMRLARQVAGLEREALAALTGDRAGAGGTIRLSVAVNSDSLATWFVPVLAEMSDDQVATFDIRKEDPDYSVGLLRTGAVMAAVTSEVRPVQGCAVESIGAMRYLALASPEYLRRYLPSGATAAALATAPMVAYDRKDLLEERFIEMHTGQRLQPPVTFLPSSRGFVDATRLGLAWGLVPETLARAALDAGELVQIAPGRYIDVPLYWQRWRLESPVLHALTRSVRKVAAASLISVARPTS
ncbi:MAG TPA: LysR family transcriptional regulator ArgP [Jiangellaceae bacterium]